ncbi:uncharacterized protein TNCV_1206821 [Trichonephila clavipes]|nr:uncharacterized protein TNCV_1206821 [Trichonephila clavipes]
MHWRHRFPMLFINSGIGSQDQTQSKPCFSSCNDLGGDLKQQPLCQDSPKDVLSDSGLEIKLAIPFVPNRDPQILLNNPSSVRSCIIIHQNEVVTNSSSIWADIWIKGLIPISKTSYGSSMELVQVSVLPAQTRIPPPL